MIGGACDVFGCGGGACSLVPHLPPAGRFALENRRASPPGGGGVDGHGGEGGGALLLSFEKVDIYVWSQRVHSTGASLRKGGKVDAPLPAGEEDAPRPFKQRPRTRRRVIEVDPV